MNQITEDYCSFEIAQLLKEKGFNIKCFDFYEQEVCGVYDCDATSPQPKHSQRYDPTNWNDEDDDRSIVYSRPTHQMALKWMREVHKYVIIIDYKPNTKKYFSCIKNRIGTWVIEYCDSYEQAAEVAILYVLKKLI